MKIRPIKTRKDYEQALKEVEKLMTAKANTPEGERLDVLATLIEAYEAKHFALDLPDPVYPGTTHVVAQKVNGT